MYYFGFFSFANCRFVNFLLHVYLQGFTFAVVYEMYVLYISFIIYIYK